MGSRREATGMKSPRYWTVVLLMSMTALALHLRGDTDLVPSSRPLNELPMTIGVRTATDITLDEETLEVLGKGEFLDREYAAPRDRGPLSASDNAQISLLIAYFPTQRSGQSIHSPQNCLPGAGWIFQTRGVTDLIDPTGKKYSVGEYLISNGNTSDEVLYWYRVHGRSIASDYKAKLYTLADSIRYRRTDAALVRIITPVLPGEDRKDAHQRAVDFANRIVPLLPAYVPD
jgi:EpsI family protein